jgi:hypothetical protein
MTVAVRRPLSRYRGLVRKALGALMVAGIGAVALHGFGWHAWGSAGSGSPVRVLIAYFQNGVAMMVLGFIACWAALMPIMWIVALTTGVRRAYRSVVQWCLRVRREGMNPSLAVAFPWLAAIGFMAATIAATGGIQGVPFWLAALFSLGVSAFIAVYAAAWVLAILRFLAQPAVRLLRPLTEAIRSEFRQRLSVGFNATVAVGVAGAIYSGMGIQLDAPASLRLPIGDPVMGSFSVFVTVAIVAVGISVPIKRFRRVHLYTEAKASSNLDPPSLHPVQLVLAPPPVPFPTATVVVPPAPPRPAPPVPWDVPEPDQEFWSPTTVDGWRVWRWTGRSLRGFREDWPGALHTARCSTCQEVPDWSHTCGIYAVVDRADLWAFGPTPFSIVGKVELSGLVIEHDHGYRSTHARVVELWVPQSIDIAEEISRRYPDVTVHRAPPSEGSLV